MSSTPTRPHTGEGSGGSDPGAAWRTCRLHGPAAPPGGFFSSQTSVSGEMQPVSIPELGNRAPWFLFVLSLIL